jgi:hippurate hydrolase
MNTAKANTESLLKNLDGLLPDLEALYKDIHAHPELSMQEMRTASLAAGRLRAAGYLGVAALAALPKLPLVENR